MPDKNKPLERTEPKALVIHDVSLSLPPKEATMKELLNRFGYTHDEDGSIGANCEAQLKIFSFLDWLYQEE